MLRMDVDGASLAYEIEGDGEPVVCIHGALIADSFKPLLRERSLTSGYRLITYHRRGYGRSSATAGPVRLTQQATDCRQLLDGLSADRAHVVGHSFGGVVALQMSLEYPELVHTLALLEPAIAVGRSGHEYLASLRHAVDRFEQAGGEVVADEFLGARFGEGYREPLEQLIPGAMEQAAANAETSLRSDLPGLLEWQFGDKEARSITQPTLVVLGADSTKLSPRFAEAYEWLIRSLPNAEGAVLNSAAHGLQMQNPKGMSARLAWFFGDHRMD